MTIILLLLGECTVCIIAVFWPHILGIDVRPARLIRALQRSYSVPGREQFTAALDLAQTTVRKFIYHFFYLYKNKKYRFGSTNVF